MPCRLGSSILILILASFDAAAQSPYDNGPSIHPTPETSAGCGSGTIVMDSIAGETGSISLCWDTIYALLGVYDSPAIAPADNGASGGQFPSSPSGSNEQ